MKKTILHLILISLIFITGCVGNKTNICSTLEEGQESFICSKISNPENADILLQLFNYELIKKGVYTKEDALSFLNKIETYLVGATTYRSLVMYISSKVEEISGELFILSQYMDVLNEELPISEFDRNLLKIHLERQRLIIETML